MKIIENPQEPVKLICLFVEVAAEDVRVNAYHISLYAALIMHWSRKNFEVPLQVFSKEIMPLCKISGAATYHRTIKDLHEFGYIKYEPSFNHFERSKVHIIEL